MRTVAYRVNTSDDSPRRRGRPYRRTGRIESLQEATMRVRRSLSLALAAVITVGIPTSVAYSAPSAAPSIAPDLAASSSPARTAAARSTTLGLERRRYATGVRQPVSLRIWLNVKTASWPPPAVPGRSTVRLQHRRSGSTTWTTVRTVVLTDGQGSVRVEPTRSGQYRALFVGKSGYRASRSNAQTVVVDAGRWSTLTAKSLGGPWTSAPFGLSDGPSAPRLARRWQTARSASSIGLGSPTPW